MDSIPAEHIKEYEKETRNLLYQRVFVILWIGIILIPLFSILDYIVVHQYLKEFFIYRITCSGSCLLLLALHLSKVGKNHPFLVAIIAYIIAGSTISLMVFKMGGYASFYYVGIVMVLVTFAAMLPLSAKQSIISGVLLYFIYAAPILLFSSASGDDIRMFLNNSFFFIFFIVISVVQCYEDTKGRITQFNLRMDLDKLAERLSYYAHNLEAEVDKRTTELRESELKYKELYENIIDIVILTDINANIIMANPRFYETTLMPNTQGNVISLFEIIHPQDKDMVKKVIFGVSSKGKKDIKNIRFRIVDTRNKTIEVECNTKQVEKDGSIVGMQMVLRDITDRKKLESALIESNKNVQDARIATILGLAKLAEYRDSDTGAHLERIREYSKILAEELAKLPRYKGYITKEYIDDLYNSSILHDIGKVGIPDSILLKPGRLTPDEFEIVKQHSKLGGDAIRAIETKIKGKSFLTLGKEIAYYHHERWNGKGYPEGLKGEEIPLSARIVALADVYDALTSKRTYKEAFSHEKAKDIIIGERGSHFDPDIVDAFIKREKEFKEIRIHLHTEGIENIGIRNAYGT